MAEEKKEESGSTGFTVSDRRHFTPQGGVKDGETPPDDETPPVGEAPAEQQPPESSAPPEPSPPEESSEKEASSGEAAPEEHPVDFVHLVLSLYQTALLQLGEIPDPVTGKSIKNLTAASQSIDLLGILKEKTAGNLTSEEEKILEHSLTDLRPRFVNASGFLG